MNTSGAGGRGRVRGCIPISCGRRSALRRLHGAQEVTMFSQLVPPPRERGTTWSTVSRDVEPQYWQHQPSRAKTALRVILRAYSRGARTYVVRRMTVG